MIHLFGVLFRAESLKQGGVKGHGFVSRRVLCTKFIYLFIYLFICEWDRK